MTYIVLFEDTPADLRARHMPAHLAFLAANAAQIQATGPLRTPDDIPAGGLWIVTAPDAARVDAHVRADPLWPTGLRRSVRILAWTRVFADGKPLGPG